MKKHSLRRVVAAVYGTPWAITPEKMADIVGLIEHRRTGALFTREEIAERIGISDHAPLVQMVGSVAVMNLYGVVSQRMNAMTEFSGGVSTEQVASEFARLVDDSNVTAVVLNWDSPGGSVPGVQELAGKIYEARGKKRIVSIANPMMCSAAYWLGSAASEIWASVASTVGSVGVVAVHSEVSAQREKAGIRDTIITSGANKFEANPLQPLSESAKAHTQQIADEIGARFNGAVALHRNITTANVAANFGQGRSFSATEALAAGMIDRVGTLEELLATLDAGKSAPPRADGSRKGPARTYFKGMKTMETSVFQAMVKAGLVTVDAAEDVAIAVLNNHFALAGTPKPETAAEVIAAIADRRLQIADVKASKPASSNLQSAPPIGGSNLQFETKPAAESVSASYVTSMLSIAKASGALDADGAFKLQGELIGANLTASQVADKINAACVQHAGPSNGGGFARVVSDSRDNLHEAARDALLCREWDGNLPTTIYDTRSRQDIQFKPKASNDYSLRSLKALARRCCIESGMPANQVMSLSDVDVAQIAHGIHSPDMGFLAADHARNVSGMYTNILLDASNVVLRRAYVETPATFRKWARKGDSLPDFKAKNLVVFGNAPDPRAIPENGEFEEIINVDGKVAYKLVNWGMQWSISWEATVNDSLGAFTRQPAMMGAAFPRKQNKLAYGLLKSNVTMGDTYAIFDSTNHGNDTTGAVTDYVAALNTIYTKMAVQTSLGGDAVLNLEPQFWLAPPALRGKVFETLGSTANPASNNPGVINIWQNALQPVIDAEISNANGGSDTAFYLVASTNQIDTIEYSYLQGYETPRLQRVEKYNALGTCWLIYQPFAYTVVDFRGLQRHTGA